MNDVKVLPPKVHGKCSALLNLILSDIQLIQKFQNLESIVVDLLWWGDDENSTLRWKRPLAKGKIKSHLPHSQQLYEIKTTTELLKLYLQCIEYLEFKVINETNGILIGCAFMRNLTDLVFSTSVKVLNIIDFTGDKIGELFMCFDYKSYGAKEVTSEKKITVNETYSSNFGGILQEPRFEEQKSFVRPCPKNMTEISSSISNIQKSLGQFNTVQPISLNESQSVNERHMLDYLLGKPMVELDQKKALETLRNYTPSIELVECVNDLYKDDSIGDSAHDISFQTSEKCVSKSQLQYNLDIPIERKYYETFFIQKKLVPGSLKRDAIEEFSSLQLAEILNDPLKNIHFRDKFKKSDIKHTKDSYDFSNIDFSQRNIRLLSS